MPSISLCMIVRDEEKNIRRCLESVRGVADELVIVDTGSADDTKRICMDHGAKVYDFPWIGDFAQARNYGLERASGDWILWLDADEALCLDDPRALIQLLERTEEPLVPVRLIHLYGEEPPDDCRSYRSTGFRLFRNRAGMAFTGAIHERLDLGSLSADIRLEPPGFLHIRHYGYMDSLYRRKTARNLAALTEYANAHPGDPWTHYHIAAERHRAGEQEAALSAVNLALAGFLQKGVLPPSLAYKLKYEILTVSGDTASAYPGIDRAVALYPDYVDLYFYKGIVHYAREEFGKAAAAFSYCLILGEAHPQYLVMTGVGSFRALYHLGLCYEKQKKPRQAEDAYCQALALYPGYEEANERLRLLRLPPGGRA